MADADPRPFDGVRVLDLTHVIAGPFATYQLAVLGADIIKIEPPDEPDVMRHDGPRPESNRRLMGTSYLAQAANKRAMTLNLKTPEGRDIFKRLVAGADVVVENYRAGALAALGLGADDLRAINPRLIYCAMTGFGQTGPMASVTTYDTVIQAMSGIMSFTGTPDSAPLRSGAPIIDYVSGFSAAFAIASALFQRERTGRGQFIDCSMLDAATMLMGSVVTSFLSGGSLPRPRGNDYNLAGISGYPTKDGGTLMLGVFNRRQTRRFWTAIGRLDLAEFDTLELQSANRDLIAAAMRALFLTRTAEDWEAFFETIGVPGGRVRTLQEALAMEQFQHRGVLHRFDSVPGVDGPVTVPVAGFGYEHGGPRIDAPPPGFGAHTDEILAELGLSADEIEALRAAGAIGAITPT